MEKVLKRLDEGILKLFTKFSHWFQRLTGKTNFFLARLCLFPFSIAVASSILNYWFPLLFFKTDWRGLLFCVLLFFSIMFFVHLTHDAETQFDKDPTVLSRVHLFERDSPDRTRLLLALLSPICFFAVYKWFIEDPKGSLLLALNVGAFPAYPSAFYYFVLVTPLPPGKSKVQQWVEGFQASFRKLQPLPTRR